MAYPDNQTYQSPYQSLFSKRKKQPYQPYQPLKTSNFDYNGRNPDPLAQNAQLELQQQQQQAQQNMSMYGGGPGSQDVSLQNSNSMNRDFAFTDSEMYDARNNISANQVDANIAARENAPVKSQATPNNPWITGAEVVKAGASAFGAYTGWEALQLQKKALNQEREFMEKNFDNQAKTIGYEVGDKARRTAERRGEDGDAAARKAVNQLKLDYKWTQ